MTRASSSEPLGQKKEGFVFPPAIASVAVAGRAERFAVRRIYCVGRNYAAHIREMGGDERAEPFFFQKPADALVANGSQIAYPPATADLQHEIELVLAVGREGTAIEASAAAAHVFGLALGIDLTRRDLQAKARDAGRPWESGKAFDHSAPITAIQPLQGPLPRDGRICLSVNGKVRQDGNLNEMIWDCGEIVSHLSRLFTLMPGDLIFTGTPAGVGPLQRGDHIEASVACVSERLAVSVI
jgi:fumarylpyruvate hydrolase